MKIDTRILVVLIVISLFVLVAAWRLTALPAGATWWQAWPFR